jgi:hypothetical protein
VKRFKVFLCAYDGQINTRLFELLALDEELVRSVASLTIDTMWPDSTSSSILIDESRLCLDMLEPSMN